MVTDRKRELYRALSYARRYAAIGRVPAAHIWLRRVSRLGPLSPLQVYNLRKHFDDAVLAQFGLVPAESMGASRMMTALEKRLGPR